MRGDPVSRPGNDDATVVDSPAASARVELRSRASERPSGASSGSRVTSVVTPRDALLLQEVERTRTFVRFVVVISVIIGACLTVIGGDPTAKRILVAALATQIVACSWLWRHLRSYEGYTIARATFMAYTCILGAFSGIWYFGVFSPAPVILPFGLAYFSIGQNVRAALAVYLTCALTLAALVLLVVGGAVPDQGLIQPAHVTVVEELVMTALVEVVLFMTYLLQRRTRQHTLDAIEQHDRVLRSLGQRDALLREARQELAHAMHQAGGVGRWTDEVMGTFRLGRIIGRGAMGEVYEATRVGSDEPAAVKLLHPHVLAQPELVQRFVREAKIAGSLSVANVARVLEVSPPDAPVPYLAMERLVGHDLADHLREHKRMDRRQVLTMLRQVGMGLDAAREAGVVHRDLKPRNLFFARKGAEGGIWKILDFGVARLVGEETLTIDQIVGTPNYMAPEQANGQEVTHWTDLFALGVIAYRALTGQPAFEGESTAEVLYKVVHAMPMRPSALAPLPAEIDLVLAVGLAKRPEDRFGSAAELAAAVDAAARGQADPTLRSHAERLLGKLPWRD